MRDLGPGGHRKSMVDVESSGAVAKRIVRAEREVRRNEEGARGRRAPRRRERDRAAAAAASAIREPRRRDACEGPCSLLARDRAYYTRAPLPRASPSAHDRPHTPAPGSSSPSSPRCSLAPAPRARPATSRSRRSSSSCPARRAPRSSRSGTAGGTPMRYQVRAFAWAQGTDGAMDLTPARDLVVFPPLLELAPGESRNLRVGADARPGRAWSGPGASSSRSCRAPTWAAGARCGAHPGRRAGLLRAREARRAGELAFLAPRRRALRFTLRNTGTVRLRPTTVTPRAARGGRRARARAIARHLVRPRRRRADLRGGGRRPARARMPPRSVVTAALEREADRGARPGRLPCALASRPLLQRRCLAARAEAPRAPLEPIERAVGPLHPAFLQLYVNGVAAGPPLVVVGDGDVSPSPGGPLARGPLRRSRRAHGARRASRSSRSGRSPRSSASRVDEPALALRARGRPRRCSARARSTFAPRARARGARARERRRARS